MKLETSLKCLARLACVTLIFAFSQGAGATSQSGKDRDPGVSENKIVIGTAVPASGPLAEMGQAIKAVTTAYFEELNSQGGIYNRRIELKVAETGETPEITRANLERLVKEEQVFALTGAFIAGSEKEIVPLVAQEAVPLIGPLTLYPQTSQPLNRQVFYVLSGIDGQARALIHYGSQKAEFKNSRIAVIYSQGELNGSIVEAIKDQIKSDGLSAPQAYAYVPGRLDVAESIRQLKQNSRNVVFFLGSGEEVLSFMKEADKLGWFPSIFLPGATSREIFGAPAGFNGKIFLAFPTSPFDQTAEGIKEFRALAEKYNLPSTHRASQLSACTAAKILVEGLKRAGKDLSREKLIVALEALKRFETGLTPAITYGPNRRIGALGAWVVSIDLKKQEFIPVSNWIALD
jgi:ABC-type branched-subunit amino acid transport system substrate-binding protein